MLPDVRKSTQGPFENFSGVFFLDNFLPSYEGRRGGVVSVTATTPSASPLYKGEKYHILSFMFELIVFGISALFGSGVLFAHKRLLTYIGFAGALFEAQMMATTFIARTFFQNQNRETVFLIAGIIFLTLWASLYKQWTSPYKTPGSGARDAFAGLVVLLVIAAAYPIIKNNGFIGDEFVLHGFYNGDVVTFASLVQKSMDTSGLVTQNPFSANGYLEYPTLLHGAFADFFTLLDIGKDWLRYLSVMTYAGIFFTIPLFFLVWDTVWPEPANKADKWFGLPSKIYVYALQAIVTLFAIGISFDSFTYPQSHFFLLGLEIALIAICVRAASAQGKSQLYTFVPGIIIAFTLLQANTVTGTVAATLIGTLAFVRIFDRKRSVQERALFLALGFGVLLAIKLAAHGRTGFGQPHFSVSAAGEMVRIGVPGVIVLLASIFSLSPQAIQRNHNYICCTIELCAVCIKQSGNCNRKCIPIFVSRFPRRPTASITVCHSGYISCKERIITHLTAVV